MMKGNICLLNFLRVCMKKYGAKSRILLRSVVDKLTTAVSAIEIKESIGTIFPQSLDKKGDFSEQKFDFVFACRKVNLKRAETRGNYSFFE